MKFQNAFRRPMQSSPLTLAAFGAFIITFLLLPGNAHAQCKETVAPGDMRNVAQASGGKGTPLFASTDFISAGAASETANRVQAFTLLLGGALGIGSQSAYGYLNYDFCVPGHTGDPVNSTISAKVEWHGVLATVSEISGNNNFAPSAEITMTVNDLGTTGSGPPVPVASATVLQTSFNLDGIQGVGFGGTKVDGSSPVTLSPTLTVGHFYRIHYTLRCNSPAGLLSGGVVCDFGAGVAKLAGYPDLPGFFYSQVDLLSIHVLPDLYGELAAIKAEIDNLSTAVSANHEATKTSNLAAEQDRAQILGVVKHIENLLSAAQADPTAPVAPHPTPPKHPIMPMPRLTLKGEFQRCVQAPDPQMLEQCLNGLKWPVVSKDSSPRGATKIPNRRSRARQAVHHH